jgi:bifunctional DNase/RNase
MTLMRFREITLCRAHRRATVVLEDAERRVTLTFYADPQEASRLGRLVDRGPQACHPVFDFVRGLLSAFEAGLTRVVIDDVPGEGIGSVLHVQWAGAELAVPCYPPDALALALRTGLPIYATGDALAHAQPLPAEPGMTDGDVGAWLQRVKPDDFSVSEGEGRV